MSHSFLALLNFHKHHDAGPDVAHGLNLCAKWRWLHLNEGYVGEAAELVQMGLVC